ncbi:MAG: hypothetical protein KDE09_13485 [Anaerolineales bacterium]|nr:hypothetical protein [Anaerolineales bacterium]
MKGKRWVIRPGDTTLLNSGQVHVVRTGSR